MEAVSLTEIRNPNHIDELPAKDSGPLMGVKIRASVIAYEPFPFCRHLNGSTPHFQLKREIRMKSH